MTSTSTGSTAAPVIYETIRTPSDYVAAYNELMREPSNRLRIRAVADVLRRIDQPVHRIVDIASGGGAYVSAARAALKGTPKFFPADRQYACVGGYRLNHPLAAGALADVTALPFQADSFDLALCLDIIEHLDDDVAFLENVRRVIRPGGWVLVSTHNSRSIQHLVGLATSAIQGKPWLGWDPTHLRFYSQSDLTAKLSAAGWQCVAFDGTYYLPFHLPARFVSWPLERLGFVRASRRAQRVVEAPFFAMNGLLERWSGSPALCGLGWGIVALARKSA